MEINVSEFINALTEAIMKEKKRQASLGQNDFSLKLTSQTTKGTIKETSVFTREVYDSYIEINFIPKQSVKHIKIRLNNVTINKERLKR